MLKLKLQYFSYNIKSRLVGKDPDAGKEWRQNEKEKQRMRGLDSDTKLNGHDLSNFWNTVKDREAWHSWGHRESDTTTEQQQQIVD